MDSNQIKRLKKHLPKIGALVPINSLSPRYQQQVLRQGNLLEFKANSYLFKEGARDHFSYYLLEGAMQMEQKGQVQNVVEENGKAALYPLAQLQPRRFTAKATKPSLVLAINRHLLDKVIVLQEKEQADKGDDGAGARTMISVQTIGDDQESESEEDWMVKMVQSELFSKVPTSNIYKLFEVMKPIEAKAKQVIVRQGEEGDSYYVIQAGRCAVIQKITPGKPPIKLAELGPGDSFGEEALVSKGARNASVVMLEDGRLMQLSKKDFSELLIRPALNGVNGKKAGELISGGAVYLDVRFPSEFSANPIKGSLNVPLNILRKKIGKMDREKSYIVVCDNGARSSTAAFLLAQRGFDAYFLQGGLQANSGISEGG